MERHCERNGSKTGTYGSASPDTEPGPLESRSLVERNRKNRSVVPGRGTDQGKSQEVGRTWEMAKEAEEACPGHFAALWVGGRAVGHSGRIRERVSV